MYCSLSITRPEHYMQAILCEVLFQFESQTVSFVYYTTKTTWLVSLLLEPKHAQTPSEKCGILMLKENI